MGNRNANKAGKRHFKGGYAAITFCVNMLKKKGAVNMDLNQRLYEKVVSAQERYRECLLNQPPEEILNHTYEYTIRENIILCMEDLELNETQAAALLRSPDPLSDICAEYNKRETGYMDDIRDCIETRAEEEISVLYAPVYLQSWEYAREHGETDAYFRSVEANRMCSEAISAAINENYSENRFAAEKAVRQVVDGFGFDRTMWILAATIRHMDWDGRISRDNREWAQTAPVPIGKDDRGGDRTAEYIVDRPHIGLVNMFVRQARREYDARGTDKTKVSQAHMKKVEQHESHDER